ncbi:MAG: hypothetical protein PHU21_10765 [Elusimicrobia bacterium]|nr:hypothetical protein [Elusimicrobiota bacterium]
MESLRSGTAALCVVLLVLAGLLFAACVRALRAARRLLAGRAPARRPRYSPESVLCDERGATDVHIRAGIDPSGSLQVSGQDLGQGPSLALGAVEYEYFLTVPAEDKPAAAGRARRRRAGRGPAGGTLPPVSGRRQSGEPAHGPAQEPRHPLQVHHVLISGPS